MKKLNIALIEPFYTGSHQKWNDGLASYSTHNVLTYTLNGKYWKWRMHGGAISLAEKVNTSGKQFDLFVVSDFLDLSLFKSLLKPAYHDAKYFIYFHENQLTYPWSPTDIDVELERDNHYAFINYSSALVADHILFNSTFHRNSFLNALPTFLNQFPDYRNLESINDINRKSHVLSLAIELPILDDNTLKVPRSILWNHRWEYDKNPEEFFNTLQIIKENGISFKLIVLGEHTTKYPLIFDWAKMYFHEEIIHWGYVESAKEYWHWLQHATILPVTSIQDFFGISIIEAMHAEVYPLLPNRLVYPEHIANTHSGKHLYHDNELLSKLTILLENDTRQKYSHWIEQYAWKTSIDHYDNTFAQLCSLKPD